MWRRQFCRTILAGCALAIGTFLPAADRAGSARWERAIKSFEVADKRSPPAPGGVLFIGSSSVRFWKTLAADFPQYHVINRGFGGSEIADSTAFADRIVIPYRPRVIVLHAGANDLAAGQSPEQVFTDYKAFVAKVQGLLPETPIAFVSINPTPARWAQADKQRETNRLIREYVAGKKGLAFIDIWDALLGPGWSPSRRSARPRPPASQRRRLQNPCADHHGLARFAQTAGQRADGRTRRRARQIDARLSSHQWRHSKPGRLTTRSCPRGSSGSR